MKMMLIAIPALALLGGCATVTRGTSDQVQLQSDPASTATTSMGQSCQTPCTIQVSRKDEFSVVFAKEGYESQQVDVKTQVAGSGAAGFAGNLLLGGVVGMGADAVTGATLEHIPNPVRVTLSPVAKAKPAPRPKRPARRTGV